MSSQRLIKINFVLPETKGSFYDCSNAIYNMPITSVDSIVSCEIFQEKMTRSYNCTVKVYGDANDFIKLHTYFMDFDSIYLIMNNY